MQGEEKVSELLTRVQEAKTSLTEEMLAATTLEDCIKLLSSLPHTGNFMSWQILMDLVELGFIKNQDNEQIYVELGPGALKGIDKIFGVSSDAMKTLLMLSKIMMPAFRLLKQNYKSFLGEEKISIKAIKHALCEYHKYCEAVKNGSRCRKFNHHKTMRSQDCVLCEDVPRLKVAGWPLCLRCFNLDNLKIEAKDKIKNGKKGE